MQAALKIFSRKGYSPAAVDEVAREAGIAKGTLYLYFQDKEDLFFSTIMYVFNNLASLMRDNINENANPLEILKSLAYYQLQFFSQNRDFFGIFQTILNENLLGIHKRLFAELLKREMELLDYESKIVDRGKREGFIRVSSNNKVYAYRPYFRFWNRPNTVNTNKSFGWKGCK